MSEANAYPAKAMRDQVRRIERAIQGPSPWRALTREFPMLQEVGEYVVEDGQPATLVPSQLVTLYRQYCQEWRNFESMWRVSTLPHVA